MVAFTFDDAHPIQIWIGVVSVSRLHRAYETARIAYDEAESAGDLLLPHYLPMVTKRRSRNWKADAEAAGSPTQVLVGSRDGRPVANAFVPPCPRGVKPVSGSVVQRVRPSATGRFCCTRSGCGRTLYQELFANAVSKAWVAASDHAGALPYSGGQWDGAQLIEFHGNIAGASAARGVCRLGKNTASNPISGRNEHSTTDRLDAPMVGDFTEHGGADTGQTKGQPVEQAREMAPTWPAPVPERRR